MHLECEQPRSLEWRNHLRVGTDLSCPPLPTPNTHQGGHDKSVPTPNTYRPNRTLPSEIRYVCGTTPKPFQYECSARQVWLFPYARRLAYAQTPLVPCLSFSMRCRTVPTD